jgi:N-acetylglucosaminyldiphosphoundecaprenol N-acetyl-beta-D-mannosaminyltransferase
MSDIPRKTIALFGLNLDAVTHEEAVSVLCAQVRSRPAKVVVTPNVDHVISLEENAALKAVYSSADYLFADGMPVVWASKLLGRRLPARVTGADLFVSLCQKAMQNGWRVSVLGGMPGQESMLLERFAAVYPGLQVTLRSPPMGFDYRTDEGRAAVEWVNGSNADIVFVCLGFPRQSLWSIHNRQHLNAGLVLCVGAAMEFALGLKSRAPAWMQTSGLEWLWRLASEPQKLWRRYLIRDPQFLRIVAREWWKS